jgi:hypothetical protein
LWHLCAHFEWTNCKIITGFACGALHSVVLCNNHIFTRHPHHFDPLVRHACTHRHSGLWRTVSTALSSHIQTLLVEACWFTCTHCFRAPPTVDSATTGCRTRLRMRFAMGISSSRRKDAPITCNRASIRVLPYCFFCKDTRPKSQSLRVLCAAVPFRQYNIHICCASTDICAVHSALRFPTAVER